MAAACASQPCPRRCAAAPQRATPGRAAAAPRSKDPPAKKGLAPLNLCTQRRTARGPCVCQHVCCRPASRPPLPSHWSSLGSAASPLPCSRPCPRLHTPRRAPAHTHRALFLPSNAAPDAASRLLSWPRPLFLPRSLPLPPSSAHRCPRRPRFLCLSLSFSLCLSTAWPPSSSIPARAPSCAPPPVSLGPP
jgi:hypothetical protein